MSKVEALKSEAKRLRNHFSKKNIQISNSQALEAIAAIHEHKDWNTAVAIGGAASQVNSTPGTAESSSPPPQEQARRSTVCVTPDMTIDDVREQVSLHLRSNPSCVVLRVDASASLEQHREAYMVSREIKARGFVAEVDTALDD